MRCALTLTELEFHDPRSPRGRRQRRFLCPLCGYDKPRDSAHRSLSLNTDTGAWICHRCGESGLLGEYWSQPFGHQNLRSRLIGKVVFSSSVAQTSGSTLYRRFDWRRVWHSSSRLLGTPGAIYLKHRGILTQFAETCGVRFSAAWYGRPAVLFPVNNADGNLVAVSGRFVDGCRSSKTLSAGRKSLGVFSASDLRTAPIISIVEGPIDALSLALCGLPATAMIGTSWAEWLPASLASKLVYIATDADEPGDEAAGQLSQALLPFACRALRLRPHVGKDWNEVLVQRGPWALRRLLRDLTVTSAKKDERQMSSLPSTRHILI